MVGLPKAIIKKYGVTKKAWSVYRGTKSRSRTTSRSSRRTATVNSMAKKRRSYFGKKSRRSSSGNKFKPLMDAAIGGAIVGATLRVVPQQFNTPLYRIGAGGAAAYFGSGVVKESGKILLGMEAARVTGNVMGGMTSTATATGSQSSGAYL